MSVINIITKKRCQNKFHRRKQNDKLFMRWRVVVVVDKFAVQPRILKNEKSNAWSFCQFLGSGSGQEIFSTPIVYNTKDNTNVNVNQNIYIYNTALHV